MGLWLYNKFANSKHKYIRDLASIYSPDGDHLKYRICGITVYKTYINWC